jgi:hypothetical protein
MRKSLLLPEGFSRAVLRRALKIPFIHPAWCRFGFGSISLRASMGISRRANYLYGIYYAADLARRLKIPKISVIEFGVATGRGLIAMEQISTEVEASLGISISIFGFDLGSGLPAPRDYRDLPYFWDTGYFSMDQEALRRRLTKAELILGDVAITIPQFLSGQFPPLAFVAFDLDYYSSTKEAMRVFDGQPTSRLPRVYCYFDDIIAPEPEACLNDYTGELLAIREFNEERRLKLCPVRSLNVLYPVPALWHEAMFIAHDFEHPLYCTKIGSESELVTSL